ncbi:hypothetical protein [Bacillus swezeyi]|uniref:Uncharacterized protein n=1 Tax=Bacillus swezeyi TaxID=1925020 RepID=A0A5M8RJA6_9BACI|nr:hypothetical protein [Bacillus swezeyi]KAA6446946.1 hypothetical protein DX927_23125 [Bacillus swezeyi]KAA6471514.1 hypothetical protein DX928_23365 [Bacillus swezeyi]
MNSIVLISKFASNHNGFMNLLNIFANKKVNVIYQKDLNNMSSKSILQKANTIILDELTDEKIIMSLVQKYAAPLFLVSTRSNPQLDQLVFISKKENVFDLQRIFHW